MRSGPEESPGLGRGRPGIALGIELRRIREALPGRVTQADLAKLLAVAAYTPDGKVVSTPRAYISLWENGRRIPPADVLARYRGLESADPDLLDELVAAAEADSRPSLSGSDKDEPDSDDRRPLEHPPGGTTIDPEQVNNGLPPPTRRRWLLVSAAALTGAAVVFAGGYLTGHHAGRSATDHAGPQTRSSSVGSTRTLPPVTFTETTGTPAHVWSDYRTASGGRGTPLQPRQSVQVSCRVRGYVVQDGDPWWYRLESSPWDGHYYATSDAFYNNGSDHGPVDNGVIVDEQVPLC